MPKRQSAGILLWRHGSGGAVEVLLVHPGGPYWAKKDLGAWSIPKGEYDDDEDPRACARREFAEETGTTLPEGALTELGSVRLASGKTVVAFAAPGELDPGTVRSNSFELEWPPRSGRLQAFPEIDRAAWFGLERRRASGSTRRRPRSSTGWRPRWPRDLHARGGSRTHTPFRAAGFKPTASDQFRHPGEGCMVIAFGGYPERSNFSVPRGFIPGGTSRCSPLGSLRPHPRRRRRPARPLAAPAAAVRRAPDHARSGAATSTPSRRWWRVINARLLAFCRHMLSSREDAEDVLQEVFAAAFNAILADDRAINVRPWLYRIARNRCLNHLRKQQAIGVDSMDVHLSEHGLTTADKVHKREEFRLLMADVQELAETQRTALLLREIDALSYEQIAEAMETTVPSVKSLLVRARVALAEAAEARLLNCDEVREELGQVAEGLARTSAPVRRHVRTCERCQLFRKSLRQTNRALAAVLPVGPLLLLKKTLLAHLGTSAAASGGGAAAGAGGAAAGAAAGGALQAGAGAIASKAVAGLAAAAIVTAGAVEVKHVSKKSPPRKAAAVTAVAAPAAAPPVSVASTPQQPSAPVPARTPAAPAKPVEEEGRQGVQPKATPTPAPTPAATPHTRPRPPRRRP